MQIADLTRGAQKLLQLIALDQIEGRLRHDLHDLAGKHGSDLQSLHAEIKELSNAHALRMERLGCSETHALVWFHLSADPSRMLTELKLIEE